MLKGSLIILFFLLKSFKAQELDLFLLEQLPIITGSIEKIALNLSETCRNQYIEMDQLTFWKMVDASGKFPDGVFSYNFFALGVFDQCYNIEGTTPSSGSFYGKYCLGLVRIDEFLPEEIQVLLPDRRNIESGRELRGFSGDQINIGLQLGLCFPSGCSGNDLSVLTLNWVEFISENLFCYSKATDPGLSAGAIVTIVILAIFLAILVASTLYELYLNKYNKKTRHQILVAFSAYTNGKKLLSTNTNPDQLLCLNGIKAISMMWVLLDHDYLNSFMGPVQNYIDLQPFLDDPINMFVVGSSVSVDTFFAIGGLVTVYTVLKAYNKGIKFNVPMYYIHRYIRLTPALGIMVLIHAELIEYMGQGPAWGNAQEILINDCQNYWWSALLYLQNYFHGIGTCVPQAWYLSIDFQLVLLSPLVLIPLAKRPKIGLILLGILILAGVVIPAALTYHYELPSFMTSLSGPNSGSYMWKYYKQTYTRFGPYVIGMFAGYLIFQLKNSKLPLKFHFITVLILWIISLGGLLSCLFGPHQLATSTAYDKWGNIMANGFLRSGWATALCLLIFICVAGYGGPVNWFLSLPVFQVLTKLSYTMYLVHYAVITIRYITMRMPIRFTTLYMFWSFWADFSVTVILSTILCLTFESPMITIEKILFSRGSKSSREPKQTEP